LLFGGVALVSAQESLVSFITNSVNPSEDPFVISKKRCDREEELGLSCLTIVPGQDMTHTVGMFISTRKTLAYMREINDWPESVTPETVIPGGSTIAFYIKRGKDL
jgi:hypothetical protein